MSYFVFFEFNGHAQSGDAAVTDEVIAALDGYPHVERISYSSDPRTIFQVLRECDALLGVRLHATILAYTAGVPFLLVEYHRKCSDFLDEIQFSSDDRIGDASVSEQQIVATIEAMLFDPNRRTSWQVDLNVARELAMKNFTEAPFLV